MSEDAGAGGAREPVDEGEAGAGGTAPSAAPMAAQTFDMGSATCGITDSGAAYCWGYGANGETGTAVGGGNTPAPVQGDLEFMAISTYGGHTCGVTTAGAAYCWGDGSYGAVGDGNTTGHLAKAPVAVTGGKKFTAISVGDNFSCGLVADGTAYCWGDNRQGQLGLGSVDSTGHPAPTELPKFKWQSLNARAAVACGITTAGAAYCWGETAGVIGSGTSTLTPISTPTAVPGGISFKSVVTASDEHACALTEAGVAYCWGSGTLGDGAPGGLAALGETKIAGDQTFIGMAAARNTFCGVSAAGVAYCWGGPFPATPTASFPGIIAAEVATRGLATCVVSKDGAASCQGSNSLGELGDGSNTMRSAPAPVSGNLKFKRP